MSYFLVMYRTKRGLVLIFLLSFILEISQGSSVDVNDNVLPASLLTKSLRSHNPVPYIPLNSLTFQSAANNGVVNWMHEGPTVLRQMIKNSKLAGVTSKKPLVSNALPDNSVSANRIPDELSLINTRPVKPQLTKLESAKPLLTDSKLEQMQNSFKENEKRQSDIWPDKPSKKNHKPTKHNQPDISSDKELLNEIKKDEYLLVGIRPSNPTLNNVKPDRPLYMETEHFEQDYIKSNKPSLSNAKPDKLLLEETISDIPLQVDEEQMKNYTESIILSADINTGKPSLVKGSLHKPWLIENSNTPHLLNDYSISDKLKLDGIKKAKPWQADIWHLKPLPKLKPKPLMSTDVTPAKPMQVGDKPNEPLIGNTNSNEPLIIDIKPYKQRVSGYSQKPTQSEVESLTQTLVGVLLNETFEDNITLDKLLFSSEISSKPLISGINPDDLIFENVPRNPHNSKENFLNKNENLNGNTVQTHLTFISSDSHNNDENNIFNKKLYYENNIRKSAQSLSAENPDNFKENSVRPTKNQGSPDLISSNNASLISFTDNNTKNTPPSIGSLLENVFEHFNLQPETSFLNNKKKENLNSEPSVTKVPVSPWFNPEGTNSSKNNIYNENEQETNSHNTNKFLTDSSIIWIFTTKTPKVTHSKNSYDKYTSTSKPMFSTYFQNISSPVNLSTVQPDVTSYTTSTESELTSTSIRHSDVTESFEMQTESHFKEMFQSNLTTSTESTTYYDPFNQVSIDSTIKTSTDKEYSHTESEVILDTDPEISSILSVVNNLNLTTDMPPSLVTFTNVPNGESFNLTTNMPTDLITWVTESHSLNLITNMPTNSATSSTDGNILKDFVSKPSVFKEAEVTTEVPLITTTIETGLTTNFINSSISPIVSFASPNNVKNNINMNNNSDDIGMSSTIRNNISVTSDNPSTFNYGDPLSVNKFSNNEMHYNTVNSDLSKIKNEKATTIHNLITEVTNRPDLDKLPLVQVNTPNVSQKPSGNASPLVQLNVWNYLTGHLKLSETQTYPASSTNIENLSSNSSFMNKTDISSSIKEHISEGDIKTSPLAVVKTSTKDNSKKQSNTTQEDSLNIPENLYEFVLSHSQNKSNNDNIKTPPNFDDPFKIDLVVYNGTLVKNQKPIIKPLLEENQKSPLLNVDNNVYEISTKHSNDTSINNLNTDRPNIKLFNSTSQNDIQTILSVSPVIQIKKNTNSLSSNIVNNLHSNQQIINIHNSVHGFPQEQKFLPTSSLHHGIIPKPQRVISESIVKEESKLEESNLPPNIFKDNVKSSIEESTKVDMSIMLSNNSLLNESLSDSPLEHINTIINVNHETIDNFSSLLNDSKVNTMNDLQNVNTSLNDGVNKENSSSENEYLWNIDSASLVSEYIKRVSTISKLFAEEDVSDPEISSMIENLALQSLLSYLVGEKKLSSTSTSKNITKEINSIRNSTLVTITEKTTKQTASTSTSATTTISSDSQTPPKASTKYHYSTTYKNADNVTSQSTTKTKPSFTSGSIKTTTIPNLTTYYQLSTENYNETTIIPSYNHSLTTAENNKEYAINIFSKVIIDSILKENKFPPRLSLNQFATPLTTKIESYITPSEIKITGSSIPQDQKINQEIKSSEADIDKLIFDIISPQKNNIKSPDNQIKSKEKLPLPDLNLNKDKIPLKKMPVKSNIHSLFEDQSYDYLEDDYDLLGDIAHSVSASSSISSSSSSPPSITSSFTDSIKNSVSKVTQMISDLVPEDISFQSCLNNMGCAFALASSLAIGATGALAVPFVIPLGRKKREMSEEESRIFYLNGDKRVQEEFERIVKYLATSDGERDKDGVIVMKGNIIKFLEEEMKKIQSWKTKPNSSSARKRKYN